jgi:hypothetical protein
MVPRASGPIFMFCGFGIIFGGTEGVMSRFQVLRVRTRFRRYQECRVPLTSFALPDSFSAVTSASGPVFMFCAPGLVFDGTEGVGSCFHVLRARTGFRRYQGRRVSFSCLDRPHSISAVPRSCFARPDSFSAVSCVSGPFFMFCALRIIFGDTEGVRSRSHV